jgi:FixJ family two-component response regulator
VPNSGQIKVAVVDDDESLCRSLARLLRAHGLESSTFPSAEIFLEADPADFDCLVLDLQLGGASGVELQHSLSKGLTSPPIIFITAHDDPAVRQQALDGGCAGYFKKTDPGEAIVNRIREAVATRSQA